MPVLIAFGAMVVWLLLSSRFAVVQSRPIDYLVPLIVGVGLGAIWKLPKRLGSSSVSVDLTGERSVGAFLLTSAVIGFLSAAAFSTLNGILDTHAGRRFTAVVTDTHCYRGTCRWDLAGAPVLPEAATSITVDYLFPVVPPQAQIADSVVLWIKPGAFGRAWIASRDVHHVERTQIPCVRLAQAATAGDTAQLGSLLDQGLSVEAAEPALPCQTPLMNAAKAGQVAAMEFLLRRGADPNRGTPAGETALMNAVASRSIVAVRLLLAHGADPKAVSHAGGLTRSVMGIALQVGDSEITRVLGASIERTH